MLGTMSEGIDPLLAAGLFIRGLSIVYAIVFASIAFQIRGLSGKDGITSFSAVLKQMRHDFPRTHMFYFPTLFWLTGASDAALVALPVLGVVAATSAFIGLGSPLALVSCWLIFRSLDLSVGLLYPWDSLLFETGLIATLCPALPPLWLGASAAAAPHPWVGWALRWLLARLLLGFGKKKFVGTSLDHSCYIKNFLVAQPIPSPIGWLACRFPLPLFQAALVGMFVIECVAPLFLFSTGTRVIASVSIMSLMVGIQLTGNFGYFNLLTIVLCIASLDASASVFAPLPPLSHAELALRLLFCLYTPLTFVFFLFDSWCSISWPYFPQLALASNTYIKKIVQACRFAADFRLIHAYGVFPPASNPPVRMATQLQGSEDGKTWKVYRWRNLPSTAQCAPCFVAPHHPRIDHSLFYTSFGMGPDNFLATINSSRPYALSKSSMLQRLCSALLRGSPAVRCFFSSNPFPSGNPPKFVRVRLVMLTPLSVADTYKSGEYWREDYLDEHVPTLTLDSTAPGQGGSAFPAAAAASGLQQPPLSPGSPDPLFFHPDVQTVWRTRCPKLRTILDAPLPPYSPPETAPKPAPKAFTGASARRSSSPANARRTLSDEGTADTSAALALAQMAIADFAAAASLDAATLASRFWREFVPFAREKCAHSLLGELPQTAAAARARWSPAELHAFELALGALTLRMVARLEPLHQGRKLPLLSPSSVAPTYFHLVLLAHSICSQGQQAADQCLGSTASAFEDLAAATSEAEVLEHGLCLYAPIWAELLKFHARKQVVAYEMMRKYGPPLASHAPSIVPGFLLLLPHLAEPFKPMLSKEQRFPSFTPPGPMGDWVINDFPKDLDKSD